MCSISTAASSRNESSQLLEPIQRYNTGPHRTVRLPLSHLWCTRIPVLLLLCCLYYQHNALRWSPLCTLVSGNDGNSFSEFLSIMAVVVNHAEHADDGFVQVAFSRRYLKVVSFLQWSCGGSSTRNTSIGHRNACYTGTRFPMGTSEVVFISRWPPCNMEDWVYHLLRIMMSQLRVTWYVSQVILWSCRPSVGQVLLVGAQAHCRWHQPTDTTYNCLVWFSCSFCICTVHALQYNGWYVACINIMDFGDYHQATPASGHNGDMCLEFLSITAFLINHAGHTDLGFVQMAWSSSVHLFGAPEALLWALQHNRQSFSWLESRCSKFSPWRNWL